MPAWSVPGSHSALSPHMRRQRITRSCSVNCSAWPMCSLPVTLGGGMRITYGGFSDGTSGVNAPDASQRCVPPGLERDRVESGFQRFWLAHTPLQQPRSREFSTAHRLTPLAVSPNLDLDLDLDLGLDPDQNGSAQRRAPSRSDRSPHAPRVGVALLRGASRPAGPRRRSAGADTRRRASRPPFGP